MKHDYAFAVANINTIYKKLLNSSAVERMLAAPTAQDATRVLVEMGWHDGENIGEILKNEVTRTFEYIESLGGGAVAQLFRVKYDFHNLKVLVKSELSGAKSEDSLMIDNGNFKADDMKKYILERDFTNFSEETSAAIRECFENYGKLKDAQLVDIILDKAMFGELKRLAKAQEDPDIADIIAMLIDMHNIQTFERLKRMDKPTEVTAKAFVEGGKDSAKYELYLDNARKEYFGIMPLYAYMAAKENELQNARIILICKNNGIENDVIRRSLRGI